AQRSRSPRPARVARRGSAARPRARGSPAAAPAAAARPTRTTGRAPAGPESPPSSSPSAAEQIHPRSWRLHLREVFGQVLAQHAANTRPLLGGGEANPREQLLLLGDRRRPRDLPAHDEPLEQELDRP